METKISDLDVAKKFVAIENSASTRGIEFSMTLKRIRQLLGTKKCFISGVELDRGNVGTPNQLTFDRLDNEKGYTDKNVVACSLKVNQLKRDLTVSEITMLYNAIIKKSKK